MLSSGIKNGGVKRLNLNKRQVVKIIKNALDEDIGRGDLTTELLIESGQMSRGVIEAKEDGVIAGLEVLELVFKTLDQEIELEFYTANGDSIRAGAKIAEVKGPTASLLTAERVALNFLQRMSGIATKTARFCAQVADYDLRIVDTRKTTPGLRILEKEAVRLGGGYNHRQGLYDAVMIKDNHLKAAESLQKAVTTVRNNLPHTVKIEVETESLAEVKKALKSAADIIMLDNMSLELMKEAVSLIDEQAIVEASGGINLSTVKDVAETGVDVISIGALTHSIDALDISLNLQEVVQNA